MVECLSLIFRVFTIVTWCLNKMIFRVQFAGSTSAVG